MENKNYCQSCGMLFSEELTYGKNTNGTQNEDYCCYCYPNGAFNSPNETMEKMIESCAPHMVKAGTCPDIGRARNFLQEHLPNLKRWKTA